MVQNRGKLSNAVHVLPEIIDRSIAKIKLNEYDIQIDVPSAIQKEYETQWKKE